MNKEKIKVEQVKWCDSKKYLRHIRTVVFIEEQNVPEEMEWDEYDETSVHVIAEMNNNYIATGRLLDTGQIGRMAVLTPYRNKGVGSALLEKLLQIAKSRNIKSIFLNSQIDAVDFYKKFDFEEVGGVFDDAGIPHIKMCKIFK
jgi:predicted GNAT family N-acyltransferase